MPPVRYQHSMVSADVFYMFGGSTWSGGGGGLRDRLRRPKLRVLSAEGIKNDLYIYEPQAGLEGIACRRCAELQQRDRGRLRVVSL